MACDRIVEWGDVRPDKLEFRYILEDFIGGAGTVELDGNGNFMITLQGLCSGMYRRNVRVSDAYRGAAQHDIDEERPRWIEVWWERDKIDILTRQQDEFTHAVAQYLATRLASFFPGAALCK